MARDIVNSNGELFIGFDSRYNMKDMYFPHVGQWDHSKNNSQRFGIGCQRPDQQFQFAWSDSNEFGRNIGYKEDTLVGNTTLTNEHRLGLQLVCNDAVNYRLNIYQKKMTVTNLHKTACVVKLYFQINPWFKGNALGNTVEYLPSDRALLAYQDDVYIMACATVNEAVGFHSYACGDKNEEGTRGCFFDAEDGRLEMGTIAQGIVDCIGSIEFSLEPGASRTAWYWMCFGRNEKEVQHLNKIVCGTNGKGSQASANLELLLNKTETYWRYWVNKQLSKRREFDACPLNTCKRNDHDHAAQVSMADLSEDAVRLFKRSLLIERAHADADGALIAATDGGMLEWAKDTYCYAWPRDLAFCCAALDVAGYGEPSRKALKFMQRMMKIRKVRVDDEDMVIGYLEHKFNPSGTLASSWHSRLGPDGQEQLPIQEDETALPLVALWKHYDKHGCTEFVFEGKDNLYDNFVVPAANFLTWYREPHTGLPAPSYDPWEERKGILSYTVATVYAGLVAAIRLGHVVGDPSVDRWQKAADEIKVAFEKHLYSEDLQRFVRMINVDGNGQVIYEPTIDASLFVIWYLGVLSADDPRVVRTMKEVESRLKIKTSIEGIARYVNDYYHKVTDDIENVPGNPWVICTLWLAEWYIQKAKTRDELRPAKELIDWCVKRATRSGHLAEQFHPYTGAPLSVSPLTWSHATFVLTTLEYTAKYQQLAAAEEKAKA